MSIGAESVRNQPSPPTIDHVAIAVWSIQDALSIYTERFQLRLVGNEVLDHLGVRVAYFEGDGATALQLVSPAAGGSDDRVGIREFLEEEGEGLHHVCFLVTSIDGFVARWTDPAVIPRFVGGKGLQACFLPDLANGTRIELVEAAAVLPLR